MHRRYLLAFLLLPSLAMGGDPLVTRTLADGHQLTDGPRSSAALEQEIRALDAQLFDAAFNHCDADRTAALVSADFEFYHDKWGQTAASGQAFIDGVRAMCERRRTGQDFLARRELIPGSLRVYPMNDYGAIETGSHRFYRVEAGKPDVLTETGQFTQLWKKEAGAWKLTRVLSFDHVLASP
ncbi:nuclear transport factor 2 family protein [Tahibacter amnicola]|uniref:Nuclear transport factor 2 family protein n=1 Tax=Tahibacter amnicola TaxID=2976241 RepID=A0ABY6BDW2_9GAMM|nr:nuclear transport factor 2 family protein [Tahibacter amnicola]UXI66505.1 nuclear transport factor 2 family protein [Tahibacter amnicola]